MTNLNTESNQLARKATTMMNRILRTLSLVLLTVSMLRADFPYNYIGARDVFYSLGNLPTPPSPPGPPDGDGIRLVWYQHWAPTGATNTSGALTDYFDNPFNSGRGWANVIIKFQIDRVVTSDANLDSDGFLNDPQGLIAQGIINPTVEVEFAVIEYVYGNGVVKTLMGEGLSANYKLASINGKLFWSEATFGPVNSWDYQLPLNHWKVKKLQVPISMVKFPRKAPLGSKAQPVENHLELTTDFWGNSYAVPGIRVGWSKATVKSIAPIVLVHGTNAKPATWDVPANDSFNDYFRSSPVICFNDITLVPNGGIDGNGVLLEKQVAERLNQVGAKKCHVIAHSKGGLDSRSFISTHYNTHLNANLSQPGHFEVLSLYTLDTPHRGTVLSDITWNSRSNLGAVADPNWGQIQTLMNWDLYLLHINYSLTDWSGTGGTLGAPQGPALKAQMTRNMGAWNKEHPFDFNGKNSAGRPIKFYNTASDADWNIRDGKIDPLEWQYLLPGLTLSGLGNHLATAMYSALYYAKAVSTRPSTRIRRIGTNPDTGEPVEVRDIVTELFVPVDEQGGGWNDLVVSISSAVYQGGTLFVPTHDPSFNGIRYKNHASLKTINTASDIIDQIRMDWPLVQN